MAVFNYAITVNKSINVDGTNPYYWKITGINKLDGQPFPCNAVDDPYTFKLLLRPAQSANPNKASEDYTAHWNVSSNAAGEVDVAWESGSQSPAALFPTTSMLYALIANNTPDNGENWVTLAVGTIQMSVNANVPLPPDS